MVAVVALVWGDAAAADERQGAIEERIVATAVGLTAEGAVGDDGSVSPGLDVAAIDPADGSVTNLTPDNPAEDWYASISGDGTRVAYVRRDASDPAGGEYDIWVMGADGSTKVNVTRDGSAAEEFYPNFSPDSTWIAFTRHFPSTATGPPSPGARPPIESWSVFADGSQVRLADRMEGLPVDPVISPDGRRIATRVDGDIWISDLDGSNAVNLTGAYMPSNDMGGGYLESEPDWSPDGGSIAFESLLTDPDEQPPFDDEIDVYRIDVDGSGLELLTPGDAMGEAPSFSPDGSRIAFTAAGVGGPPDVWAMGADGSNPANVTNSPYFEGWPDWGHLEVPPPAEGELGRCRDAAPTLAGTATKDILPGTRGGDVIAAETGDDQLVGGGGRDVLCASGPGAPDADSLDGGGSSDLLNGGPGADILRGGPGQDLLIGGPGEDSCKGGPGEDRVKSC